MRTKQNENGYALLIVLFLIVFIMALTAVFIRGSLSNAKQEKIVDEQQLSVIAAEMGVEYFSSKYENAFIRNRQEIWDFYYTKFINESKNKSQGEINAIARDNRRLAAKEIANSLKGLVDKPQDNDSFKNLQLEREPYVENDFFINIRGKVSSNKAVPKTLSMKLVFIVPDFLEIPSSNNDNNSGLLSSWREFERDSQIPFIKEPSKSCGKKVDSGDVCKTNSLKDLNKVNGATVYVPQNIDEGNSGNMGKITYSKVYVQGNILGDSNFKKIDHVELYINGGVKLKNVNGQGINNSIVKTQGNFEADHFETSQSEYWIRGNFNYNKSLQFTKSFMAIKGNLVGQGSRGEISGSTIIVKGDLVIPSGAKLNNGSKLCVGDNINLSNLEGDSSNHVYYVSGKSKGKASGSINLHSIDENEFNKNPEVLYSKCTGQKSSQLGDWERPILDVNYD
ncbi:hypothetical protein [Sporosarcina cyprini]|uniref:hypothetical protein n=1 Tax=Sporosarcina cyprini TaxID=2910523 RepID=UPI001EE0DC29|nr:hypothetical protein [Sporosarcina cyprini]MCG3089260.1 hypothetical protein [Sporosarcina cyprini]